MGALKPETRYIQKVHRQVVKYTRTQGGAPLIYHQKMNMAPGSPSGTPDVFYEGNKGDIWIEYKCIPKWEGRRTVPINKISSNQKLWLTRRIENDLPCAVIIGAEDGKSIILTKTHIFNPPDIKHLYENYLKTPTQVAEWIADMTIRKDLDYWVGPKRRVCI